MFRLAVSVCTVLVLSHTLNLVWCAPRDYASDIGAVSAKYPSVSGVDYAENVGLNYITALPQINYENKKALQQLRQIQQQQQQQYEEENSKIAINKNNKDDNNKKLEEEEKPPSNSSDQQDNVKYYIYILENKKDGNQQNGGNGGDNQKQLTPAKINDSKELQDWLKYFNSLPFINNLQQKQQGDSQDQEKTKLQQLQQQQIQHHQQQQKHQQEQQQQRPKLQQEKHTHIQQQQQQQQQDDYIVPDVKGDEQKERKQPKKQPRIPTNRQIDYYKYLQQLALYQASAGEIVYNKKSQQTTTARPKVEDDDNDYENVIIQQHKQKQPQQQQQQHKKVEGKKEAVLINANDFYNLYNQQLKNVLGDSKVQNSEDQYYIVGGYDQQKHPSTPYVNVLTVEPRAAANKYNLDGKSKEQIVLFRPNNSGAATMVILHDGTANSLGLKH